MDEIQLRVIKWNDHQPKSDRVRHKHWFKLKMDCGTSHGLFGLNAEQRWFFVQLLSECCRKDSDTVIIRLDRFSYLCEISKESIISAIKLLEENGTVSVLTQNCQLTDSSLTTHNITEQNITLQNRKENNRKEQNRRKEVSTELKQVSVAVVTEKVSKDSFKDFFNAKLLELYPQDYLDREKIKMEIWLVNNPLKNPKSQRGWTRFITGWLERGFDAYRKSLATEKPKKKNWMDMVEEEENASKSST
jgi:hypothetical protein